ncbi:MAG: hypothetical protein IIU08_07030 [Clostridia bacterium]|nr:hypothetical protein [Clostridia bacterium]MBQ5355606.1 hypothetical protein [Clostridia bacterium]
MKRQISLLLALTLVLLSLFSCGESTENSDEPAEAGADSPSSVTVTEEETEPPKPEDTLPVEDLGGYSFRVLNNISNFAYTNIGEEGLTGESLDDAIFNRNKAVEDTLNLTFELEKREYADTDATIKKVVAAGEDTYDFYTCDLNFVINHALSGCDVNVLTIDSLSLDNPWWNRQAIDSVSIGDAVYAFFGDLHLGYFESHAVAVFNKDILNNLNLADPYEHVHNNTWTLDNMITMLDAAKMDLNGDGKWTVDDQYGFTMYEGNFSTAFTCGGGASILAKDENNIPVWGGVSEHFVDVYNKVAGEIFDERSNNAINVSGTLPGSLELYRLMFLYGRALFLCTQIGVLKDMRDAQFELGVVPMPKYDEEQKDYRSLIFQGANTVAIPVTNPDIERTGLVLEHLCARSYTVRDVYLNQTLDFKYIQDQEGQEMMDIILSTGLFELEAVYGWGGLSGMILTGINSGNLNIVSKIAKLSSKTEAAIQKTVDAFAEVGKG